MLVLDADVVLSWSRSALRALGDAREEIDAINVFPVADSDTGTNLYLTFEAACAAVADAPSGSLSEVFDALARGAFLGARGNSGTILAQLLRGFAGVLAADDATHDDGLVFAAALRAGVDSAYAAVGEPIEGTMLTVARAAADAAYASTGSDGPAGLVAVAAAAAIAARAALDATPGQLDVLRRAGVVDAGGMGVVVLLDAVEAVLTGRWAPQHGSALPVVDPAAYAAFGDTISGPSTAAPAYEVMYLLDAPADQVAELRVTLARLGDSVVVGGGAGEWNVHVHARDAGAAIEAGVARGAVRRVSVTYLDTHTAPAVDRPTGGAPGRRRHIVAVAAGTGIAALYEPAGATVLRIDGDHRPTGADLAAALGDHDADEFIVLPNHRDLLPVAEAAAAELRGVGRRVAVIPSVAQVQGMAALAVHEPARSFDADVVAMTTAAGHARHGAVTVAESDGMTSAGRCFAGDVLGVVDGDFAVIGSDPVAVAVDVVDRMLAPGGELVTVVVGVDDAAKAMATAVAATVEREHPLVDVVVHDGGQPRYPLLLGVE